MSKNTCLAIVVPCFNEEKNIDLTTKKLVRILDGLEKKDKISELSYIYFIDDGSTDNSWFEIVKSIARYPNKVKAVKFSTNFGKQKAILAGLLGAKKIGCDAVITIDAGLQQDENKIEEFINKYEQGYKIIYGVENNRKTDNLFKKISVLAFYKLTNILGVKIPKNHSDYRLVSKEVLDVLEKFKETDLFLRGFFNEIGFKKCSVNFDVKPRTIGKSKFGFFSLLTLALNGITSYLIVPLRFICMFGFLSMILGFLCGMWAIIAKILWNDSPDGWTASIILVSFFGGMQVFFMGILGEYLEQIYREVKHRPRYLIEEELP